MKKLLIVAALFLGAAFASAGDVNMVTPDGWIAGHVGGSSTNLVTPYGWITGNTSTGLVTPYGWITGTTGQASIIVQTGLPALLLLAENNVLVFRFLAATAGHSRHRSLVFTDSRGFLSVVWRVLMVLVLIVSIMGLTAFLAYPMAGYRTQFIVGYSAGLMLSICALVRSFLKKTSL